MSMLIRKLAHEARTGQEVLLTEGEQRAFEKMTVEEYRAAVRQAFEGERHVRRRTGWQAWHQLGKDDGAYDARTGCTTDWEQELAPKGLDHYAYHSGYRKGWDKEEGI